MTSDITTEIMVKYLLQAIDRIEDRQTREDVVNDIIHEYLDHYRTLIRIDILKEFMGY